MGRLSKGANAQWERALVDLIMMLRETAPTMGLCQTWELLFCNLPRNMVVICCNYLEPDLIRGRWRLFGRFVPG